MTARSLHIVICNERLLPRFGVDRLLLLLGGGLRQRGHRITFVCQRCDRDAVATVPSGLVVLDELGRLDIHGAEATAASWLAAHWAELSPDVVVTGGWPFFAVARVCAERGVPSLFIDAGAVPQEGVPAAALPGQRELRRVRAGALPVFDAVLPISDFIRQSQTLPERGTARGVHTVLLGADHMEVPLFGAVAGEAADAAALADIRKLDAAGHPLLLLLGRFEPEGYKNSVGAYEILARILAHDPRARLLVLARPEDLHPPEAIRHAVVALGFIGDAALGTVMSLCRLGLAMSRWEGFNLPLAEMQWAGRPVLAFSLAAHPEVTADPWLLCDSMAEMADKAVVLLRHGLPPHMLAEDRFAAFRRRFGWDAVIARYGDIIAAAAAPPAAIRQVATRRRVVVVDCSNASIDPANPGVIRVVRRLGHALQSDPLLCPIFVRWDLARDTYRILDPREQDTLASYDGPRDGISGLFSPAGQGVWPMDEILDLFAAPLPPVLFLPEVVLDGRLPERLIWARARGMAVAALLYDLIPVTHSPFCAPDVVGRFPEYLAALATADAIWAISGESLRQFELYLARQGLPPPPRSEAIWLPAQFSARPRVTTPPAPPADGEPLTILCVGSIEPRKNHRNLIEAFQALCRRRPDLTARLVMAGNRFGGADALAHWMERVTREDPRITWTGLISDAGLAALFDGAAFTVYPSLVEGFGLPVVESLWLGRPVLCHSDGVMAEIAANGGCLTADMADQAEIARALERMIDDAGLRRRLTEESLNCKLADWAAYGATIGARLHALHERDALHPAHPHHAPSPAVAAPAEPVLDDVRRRIKHEADMLRGLPVSFVTATDIPA